MSVTPRWSLVLASAAVLLATGACSSDDDDGESRICMDGSRPLAETGVCEFAGGPGDPCDNNWDCVPGSICFNAAYCVGSGTLRVTLSFDVNSDFDLHVLTPNGNEIYFATDTADGGTLDVDQCISGIDCPDGETHVENVVFPDTAPSGAYEVWVVNYEGRASGAFRLDVVTEDGEQSFTGELPAEDGFASEHFTFSL